MKNLSCKSAMVAYDVFPQKPRYYFYIILSRLIKYQIKYMLELIFLPKKCNDVTVMSIWSIDVFFIDILWRQCIDTIASKWYLVIYIL